uniref:Uncharacterized protein n=1 Tax=Coccidioides posadasii RMSCC 3488 TaxID=454284 RepID=A0A0J6FRS1_COCPO|nr:hypothetical protein CPAG_09362 [Coccidioides posadasii RMSCC 3488]
MDPKHPRGTIRCCTATNNGQDYADQNRGGQDQAAQSQSAQAQVNQSGQVQNKAQIRAHAYTASPSSVDQAGMKSTPGHRGTGETPACGDGGGLCCHQDDSAGIAEKGMTYFPVGVDGGSSSLASPPLSPPSEATKSQNAGRYSAN